MKREKVFCFDCGRECTDTFEPMLRIDEVGQTFHFAVCYSCITHAEEVRADEVQSSFYVEQERARNLTLAYTEG